MHYLGGIAMKIKAGAWQSLKDSHKEILIQIWHDKSKRKSTSAKAL